MLNKYNNYNIEELLIELKEKYEYLSKDEFNIKGKVDMYFDEIVLLNKETQDNLYDNLHDKLVEEIINQVNTTNHEYFHFNNFGVDNDIIYMEFYKPNIIVNLTEENIIQESVNTINKKLEDIEELQLKEIEEPIKLKEYTLEDHFKYNK